MRLLSPLNSVSVSVSVSVSYCELELVSLIKGSSWMTTSSSFGSLASSRFSSFSSLFFCDFFPAVIVTSDALKEIMVKKRRGFDG